jgi:hypothetical protein
LHGNAQYFWNGSVLNATDWITKALGDPRPFDIANQWAGSVGGPIKRSNLFFFFDTEGLRVLLPTPVQVVLPSSQFEAATIANVDSIFGSASASDAFYKKIFDLYNATPGWPKQLKATLIQMTQRVVSVGRGQEDWEPTHRAPSIFRKQLGSRPVNPLCLAVWIGTSGSTIVLSFSSNTTTAVKPRSSTR